MSQTLTFTLIGGSGGDIPSYGSGGQGTKVTTKLSITSGTILYLAVGSAGDGGSGSGGYNGGGGGIDGGGGGGGATHVALETGTLVEIGETNKSNVLIVAAGGGGGAAQDGGNAGINGNNGSNGSNIGGAPASGGTSSNGGSGGYDGGHFFADSGGFGFGGAGADMGSGGGSGYYGGGGGASLDSGGGGYSFVTTGYNFSDTEYQNVSDTPSITIADSDGNTLFTSSTSGQILTYNVQSSSFFSKVTKSNGITLYTFNGKKTLASDLTITSVEEYIINYNNTLIIDTGVTLTNNGTITTDGTLIKNGRITGTGTIVFNSINSYNNTSDVIDIKTRVHKPLRLSTYNGLKTTITIAKKEKLFINRILNIDKDVTLKINGKLRVSKINNNGKILGKYNFLRSGGGGKKDYITPKETPFLAYNGTQYSYDEIKESLDKDEPIYLNDINYEKIIAIIDFVSYDNNDYAIYITDKLNTLNHIFNEFTLTNNEEEMYSIANHYERIYSRIDIMFKYIHALKLLFYQSFI